MEVIVPCEDLKCVQVLIGEDKVKSLNFAQKKQLIVVTIPATSSSAERAFSSLKRIHTYLRNTQGQERLSELSVIAIEKQLLVELKRSPTFYSDVIKSFLKKDRRFQLEYK